MNVDGSAGVSADFNAGARVGILLPISIGLVLGCLVLGVLAVILVVLTIRQPRATVAVPSPSVTASGQGGTTGATTRRTRARRTQGRRSNEESGPSR
ncbi:MAG TPA: hypothetical protein VMS99_16585 [Acidimicrobiia bacterium]|nr:hypothetical protein [Acidimicrobiia bacterium]